MNYILTIIIGYVLGSINSSIIVGRLWKKVDIRNMGSGNAGATNTLRSLGKGPAAVVLLGDVLKGVIAVLLGRLIIGEDTGAMLGGLTAVIGHNWPVFFQFKGGKGILTSAAVIISVTPAAGIAAAGISVLIIAVTRYVSLGSIIGALIYPVLVATMYPPNTYLISFSAVLALLAIYRHRANIERLSKGTESKLGSKKAI